MRRTEGGCAEGFPLCEGDHKQDRETDGPSESSSMIPATQDGCLDSTDFLQLKNMTNKACRWAAQKGKGPEPASTERLTVVSKKEEVEWTEGREGKLVEGNVHW